jgi:hypothetical protein
MFSSTSTTNPMKRSEMGMKSKKALAHRQALLE